MFRSTYACFLGFLFLVTHASAQFTELAVFDEIQMGGDVAFGNDKLAITQSSTDTSIPDSVSVFELNGTLLGSVQAPLGTDFGAFVAIDEDSLILGDPFYKPSGFRTSRTGRAYIYDVNLLSLRHVLDDPEARDAGQFGYGLDVANGIAAVGRRGSNLYLVDSTSGEFLLDLEPPDISGYFGEEVTILGDTMLVGASWYPPAKSGAFHVYDFPSGEMRFSVFPEEKIRDAFFGGTLALTSERMFVSAQGINTVFAYDREGNPVGQISMSENAFFGRSMVATDDFLAISLTAPSTIGKVFLYDPMTLQPIGSIDGTDWGQEFGRRLAAKDNLLLAGPLRGGPVRLFSIPEPSTSALATLCGICLLVWRKRIPRESTARCPRRRPS